MRRGPVQAESWVATRQFACLPKLARLMTGSKSSFPGLGHAVKLSTVADHRIYSYSFAGVYPHYIAKAEKKGRTKEEVDEAIRWLTGYSQTEFESQLEKRADLKTFFAEAPQLNPSRALIKGVVCGIRVEEIEDPLMRDIRYMDKLIDELAKGRPMEKILRKE